MSKYIETSEATAVIADYFDLICDTEYRFNESDILKRLNNSAVDAVPVKHGKWRFVNCATGLRCQCSECLHWVDAGTDRNYCPNCGARMDEE